MMVKNNSGVYFLTQNNAWNDQQLWHTDGTNKGTVLLKSSPGVTGAVTVKNTAYFATWGNGLGFELWKTDGTPVGTTSVKVLDHYPRLVDVAGVLFFYNDAGEVWKSDGTSAGTVLLKTFPSIEHVAASGSIAYIMVRSASGGQELWKSNGLPARTVKVKTIRSVEGPWTPNHVTSTTLGNIFYFIGHDGQHGHELWRTDGTDAGTFMVKDNRASDNLEKITDIWRVTTFNNAIYFNARDAGGEMSLFRSDGTNDGTKDIYDSDRISEFMPYNDQLLFISQGTDTQRLFATDGTTAGTMWLKDLPPNYGWWISHVQMNDILYFSFSGSDVMWRTDGTECGTVGLPLGVTKIDYPIPASSNLLLFSAHHHFYGQELFSMNVNDLPIPSCPESFAARQETSDEGEIKNVTYNPNPFDRDFTFVVNSNLQSTAEVAVYDMAGHPLMLDILETNKPHQLGNNWKEGLYIMRIAVDGKVTYKRVVKGRQ
jgi:ELWxxDGT repeat protein